MKDIGDRFIGLNKRCNNEISVVIATALCPLREECTKCPGDKLLYKTDVDAWFCEKHMIWID